MAVFSVPSVPKPDDNNTPMCIKHALFLHSLQPGLLDLTPLFFAIVSAILTHCIRSITPGICDKPKAPTPAATTATTPPSNIESTAIPDLTNQTADVEAGEAPPPYAPPSTAASPIPTPTPLVTLAPETAPAKPKLKRTSAFNFTLGTVFFLPLLFSIFCMALSIQWLTFCQPHSPSSTTAQVFSWLFFCIPTFWATYGVLCYAMLVRDLWGPKMRERFPFGEDAFAKVVFTGSFHVALAVVCVVGSVVAAPFVVLVVGMVKCVEWAQRRCCGDALVDEEEGLGGGVELRGAEEVAESEATGVAVENDEGNVSEGHIESDEHEESVGLIRGMKK